MERLLSWIRDNPQFAALTFGALVLVIVMAVLTIAMTQAGVSLRPLIWFFGFFGLVAGPQALVHLLDGFVLRRERAQPAMPSSNGEPAVKGGNALSPVSWDAVFGPHADPTLITDAKLGLAAVLGHAEEAKLSFRPDGTSALAARFASATFAQQALDKYGTFFAFAQPQGSDANGWTARRHAGQGEWVHIVTAGPELYAWTNANRDAAIASRVHALGPIEKSGSVTVAGNVTSGTTLVSKRLASRPGFMVGFMALNLVVAGLWFFKGSAWAARVDRTQMALPASADTLRRDLMAINQSDVPTRVMERPDGTIEVTWRYADARWFDLMRVHQMKRIHQLVLIPDEANHTVRVREYWSAFDASANARDVRVDWKAATGIQFFAFEHKRVFGAQLGPDGKPTGELSKAYTFNLQALKSPLIDVITRSGWHWQPVTWNGPASLRWLTE